MTQPAGRTTGRHGRRRHRGRRYVGGLLLVLLLVLAWAGWHVWQGVRTLESAATGLRAMSTGLDDLGAATGTLARIAEQTSDARQHFDDPVVRALAALPTLGEPLAAAAAVSRSADLTVREALLPLVEAAGNDPAEQITAGPGAVDVDYLASLAPPAQRAARSLAEATTALSGAPTDTVVERVDVAVQDFTTELSRLRTVVDDVALALDVAPELLAQGGTKRYLVLSQSPAEARGTGGLLGGYSLLQVTDGALSVIRSGPRSDLQNAAEPVVDLGVQYDDHYGGNVPTTGWINANLSPHLPFAAQIWTELWERQYAEQLDGILLLDPIALSYLLGATGPVPLPDGAQVTADNVADLTMRDIYARFPAPAEDPRRDAVLQQVSAGVAAALTTREIGGRALVEALDRGVDAGRLMFWSADEAIQDKLATEPISGTLPQGKPAVGDVIVDAAGSKLDYYLERDLRYTAGCGEPSTLVLTLTNAAPASGLPAYVTPENFRRGQPPGTNILLATLYLPPRSVVETVTLEGEEVFYRQGTELGLIWVEVLVTLLPGESAELAATFTEPPGSDGQVARVEQPLVRPETFTAVAC